MAPGVSSGDAAATSRIPRAYAQQRQQDQRAGAANAMAGYTCRDQFELALAEHATAIVRPDRKAAMRCWPWLTSV